MGGKDEHSLLSPVGSLPSISANPLNNSQQRSVMTVYKFLSSGLCLDFEFVEGKVNEIKAGFFFSFFHISHSFSFLLTNLPQIQNPNTGFMFVELDLVYNDPDIL